MLMFRFSLLPELNRQMAANINIGLFGFGTVGKGVYELIERDRPELEKKIGKQVSIAKVAVARPELDRGPGFSRDLFTDDCLSIVNDETVNLLIELTGNSSVAAKIIGNGFANGKSVITASKELLAHEGPELYEMAKRHKVSFGFEAAVCSGTPVIQWLTKGYAGDQVTTITGILNSTSNYILCEMEKGISFQQVLNEAQQAGYAEPDAGKDVQGLDTAHKLTILIHNVLDESFNFKDLKIRGIDQLKPEDVQASARQNQKIRLIGHASKSNAGIDAWVRPVQLPMSHPLADVEGLENSVLIESSYGGTSSIKGIGAGAQSAASGVISDMINLLSK